MAEQQLDSTLRTFGADVATFVGTRFDNAAARMGAGQSRWIDTPVLQVNPLRFYYLKPRALCFTPDGSGNLTVPATNRGTWGTRNDHWLSAATLEEVQALIEALGNTGGGGLGTATFLSLLRAKSSKVQVMLPESYPQAGTEYFVNQRVRGTNRKVFDLRKLGFKNDAQLSPVDGDKRRTLVAGVGTDNAQLLLDLQAQIAATASRMRLQGEFQYLFPKGGVSKWTNNLWQSKINNLVVDLNGGAVVTDYDGTDNMEGRISFNGEMMQIKLDSYKGTKDYVIAVKILDVTADSFTIQAVDKNAFADAETWFEGAYVFDWSNEMVFRGYPIGAATFGDGTLQLTKIDRANGVLTFNKQVGNDHSTKGPDFTATKGAESGVGRIISLDNPQHPIPDYVEWKNGDVYAARNCPEAFAMVSRVLTKLTNLRFFGNLTFTESLGGIIGEDLEIFEEAELDKVVGGKGGYLLRCIFHHYVSNAGGFSALFIRGGKSLVGIQVAAPYTTVYEMECRAKTFSLFDVTTNTTKIKDTDPAIGRYPGLHHVIQKRIGRLLVGATNNTDAYIDTMGIYSYYIVRLEGGRIAVDWDGSDNLDQLWPLRCLREGSLLMSKQGRWKTTLAHLEFVPADATLTSGKFLLKLADNSGLENFSELLYNNIRGFVDEEGHRILTPEHPAKLYSRDMLRWKGNRDPDVQEPGTVVLTKADLKPNQYGADFILWLAGMYEVTYAPSAAGPGGRLTLALVDENNNNLIPLVSFATASGVARTAGVDRAMGGMSGLVPGDAGLPASGEPDLNQFRRDNFSAGFGGKFGYRLNIFTNVPLVELPDFQLIITPRNPAA